MMIPCVGLSSSGFAILGESPSASFSVSFYFHSSVFNYSFVWYPIFNPFNPLADPLCRLYGIALANQTHPFYLCIFLQVILSSMKGEVVSLLIHLDLHRSFQAGDEIGFSPLLLFHYISLESSRGEMLSTDEVSITLLDPLQDLSRVATFNWGSATLT